MVNEPSVFEPPKFYCIRLKISCWLMLNKDSIMLQDLEDSEIKISVEVSVYGKSILKFYKKK